MKTKKNKHHSTFTIRHSAFTAIGAALVTAITLFTTAARAPAQTVWGNVLSFDGTNDYVQADAVPLANASFTIEAWARRDTTNTMDMIVGQGVGSLYYGLMFGFHWFGFDFDFYGDLVSSANIDTAWHHWAGAYDATSRVQRLYRDGVLLGTHVATQHYQGSGPLYIGQAFGAVFAGAIDEVRIWSVARSQAEIQANLGHPLTGSEANLMAYWNFDEGTGTTAQDRTTNGHNGTLVNGPQWKPATLPFFGGNALSFDGTNDCVRTLILPLASNYTISAWVFLRSSGSYSGYRLGVLGAGDCNSSVEVLVHNRSDGSAPQYLYLGRCGAFDGTNSTLPVPTNQWVHLAVTVSSNKQVSYFINSVPAGSWNGSALNLTLGLNITLGDNALRRFNGILDDFRIWNKARTQAEIQADWLRPLTGSEAYLVGYWNFDEGGGIIAYDSTTNGYDGMLFGGPQWTPSTVPIVVPNSPVFTICRVDGPGQLRLQATGSAGLTYTLQTSTNLVDWADHTNLVADPGGLIEYLVEMEALGCFYRLKSP